MNIPQDEKQRLLELTPLSDIGYREAFRPKKLVDL